MGAYKTRSDRLMLMRQIKNLKDMDSNLGGDLEVSSRTFLSGVQIVRTGKKPEVKYDSDNEEDNEQLQCVQYIQQQQKVLTGGKTSVTVNSNSGSRPTISYGEDPKKKKLDDDEARRRAAEEARNRAIEEARKKNLQKESGKLKSIEEEALQKHKDNEARRKREEEEARRREREERERKKREEEEAKRREKEDRERKQREEEEARRREKEEEEAAMKKAREELQKKIANTSSGKYEEELNRRRAEFSMKMGTNSF